MALILGGSAVYAQSYLETFGQNRIQYRKFRWKYFDTKHFRVYHYDAAGRHLGRYVAEESERDIAVIEHRLGGQFPKRFNIILYNNYDEYKQNNIGLKYDGQIQDIQYTGSVDLVGDKLVVYFTGRHEDLKRQIREGIAKVVMERMLFGENLRQVVKNALLLNLPSWVTEGFISYVVDGWDTKTNTQWKNLLSAQPNKGFYDLAQEHPELAGKAFWEYMSQRYDASGIRRLLYAMQQKSSLNKGLKQVVGMKIVPVFDSCINFYKGVYAADAVDRELPDSTKGLIELNVPRDNTVVRNIKVSPRGSDVAYVTWKDGEYNVYIQHTQKEQSRSLILEGGRKDYNATADPNYPLLAWSNNGYKLAILYKKGTQTRLRIYNSFRARIENYIIPANRVDRVLGMDFMEDDDFMVFSAIKRSQTDLYNVKIRGFRMSKITDDLWDDVEPSFVSGGTRRGIIFLSNRPKPNLNVPLGVNEMPTGPMNIFFYDTKTKSPELLQCSHVTKGHISQPIQYGSENFAYLYDENGIRNKYVVMFGRDRNNKDSAYAVPVTNYAENILSHQYNPASNEVADVVQEGPKYRVYFKPLEIPGINVAPKQLKPTILFSDNEKEIKEPLLANIIPVQMRRRHARVQDGYNGDEYNAPLVKGGNTFQSEFSDNNANKNDQTGNKLQSDKTVNQGTETQNNNGTTGQNSITTAQPQEPDSTYIKMRPYPYRLSFRPDFFTVRIDNSILFNQYQSYQNNGGSFTNPSLSGLITVSLNDMMENHRFTGGFQLPINFSSLTYFLQYQNFERRIDWGLMFLHTDNYFNANVNYVDQTGQTILTKQQLAKATTNMLQGNLSYPIDHVRSIRFHSALRQDVAYFKATDTLSLYDIPHNIQYWSMSRLEFVFDNTTNPVLNIRYGFRYKFYGEYLYGLNNGNKGCYNVGLDFRYYKKVYKNFIWATRIAGEHSEGNDKVVFYLGGVDNWINPKYSDYVPVNGGPYAFQALATSLRGYTQNSRNGNTYAVMNTELRLPVLTTFLKRPIQSSALKNLQLIAFADLGSAWNGLLPTKDNTTSGYVLPTPGTQGNVILNLAPPNDLGFGLGYGAGIRTLLLGYFMRLDAAWRINGPKKPMWYLSIGTDF